MKYTARDGKTNIRQHGFTIVELLIVIVVIAILAAISIAAYTGIQNRSRESAKQSEIASMQRKIQFARAETDAFPVVNAATPNLAAIGLEGAPEKVQLMVDGMTNGNCRIPAMTKSKYCVHSDSSGYQIVWWSDKENRWKRTSQDGVHTTTAGGTDMGSGNYPADDVY